MGDTTKKTLLLSSNHTNSLLSTLRPLVLGSSLDLNTTRSFAHSHYHQHNIRPDRPLRSLLLSASNDLWPCGMILQFFFFFQNSPRTKTTPPLLLTGPILRLHTILPNHSAKPKIFFLHFLRLTFHTTHYTALSVLRAPTTR